MAYEPAKYGRFGSPPQIRRRTQQATHSFQTEPQNSALFQFKLQYSREEAAELLGVSLRTLDRLIAEKQITVRRIGRRVLIGKEVLTQFSKRDSRTAVIQ